MALTQTESMILQLIYQHGQLTRGDVARQTALSQAMVARVVARLLDGHLIREASAPPTSEAVGRPRGRQADLLEVNPDVGYIVSLDIGTLHTRVLIADLLGHTVALCEMPSVTIASGSPDEVISSLAAIVRAILAEHGIAVGRLAACGIALTGIVDSAAGVCVVRSQTQGWENLAIADLLGAELGLPVVIEETSRAKALAEARWGQAVHVPNFMYVDLGIGMGAGVVLGGQVLWGDGGLAGELGHITVDPAGRLCRCGNYGCPQTVSTATAIVQKGREMLAQGLYSSLVNKADNLTLADVADAAVEGDKLAVRLLTEAGEYLGVAIATALDLLGLNLVIVGGGVIRASEIVLDVARRTVTLRALPLVPRERSIVASTLGADAGARGAAVRALNWLFDEGMKTVESLADKSLAGSR